MITIRVHLLILFWLLCNGIANGQRIDPRRINYSLIDKHALTAPDSVCESFETLTAYLIKPAKNDFEKVRAVYTWITANVVYDHERYNKDDLSYYETVNLAGDALVNRKSICAGYAALFAALCTEAEVYCKVISGYARNADEIGKTLTDRQGHSWNAVQIQNRWYFLNSTWGAGSRLNKETGESDFAEFFAFYFLTDPKKLIITHFPEDPQWQFLPQPISKSTFENLPFIWPGYYQAGFTDYFPKNGLVVTDRQFFIILNNTKPVDSYITVMDEKGRIMPFDSVQEYNSPRKGQHKIQVTLEEKGVFSVMVRSNGISIIDYKVRVK